MFSTNARTLSRIEPAIRRVVIVDPNMSAVRLLTDIMKGMGAREVYSESDEERALELLRDVEPGVIFTERSGETLNGETLGAARAALQHGMPDVADHHGDGRGDGRRHQGRPRRRRP